MALVDFTEHVEKVVKERFVGHEVFQSLTTYIDNTEDIPIIGGKSGNEIKARGSVKIRSFESLSGRLLKYESVGPGIPDIWITDPHLILKFRYTSQTHGERWIWPGGVFTENVWDSLHPEGTITATLYMRPQSNAVLKLEITVEPGHDDRPGNFIKDRVAPMCLGKLDALLEEIIRIPIE